MIFKRKKKDPICPDCGQKMQKVDTGRVIKSQFMAPQFVIWLCGCNIINQPQSTLTIGKSVEDYFKH